jgi:hypothetical protein
MTTKELFFILNTVESLIAMASVISNVSNMFL